MLRYRFQLQDREMGGFAGPAIIASGGKCLVCAAGDPAKATLMDADGVALANPITLTRGGGIFYVADTAANAAVDLFILTGEGHSIQLWSVGPDELHDVPVDRGNTRQMLVLPFSIDDQVADATAVDTGLDLAAGMVFEPWPYVKIVTTDAGITVDAGITGDEDGFISAASTTTGGLVKDVDGTLITGITTYTAVATNLLWKFLTGADTAEGYFFLPYMLMITGTPIITEA